jgi:hypothetical protein
MNLLVVVAELDGGELDLDPDPHWPKMLDPEPMRIQNTALLFSACVNMWDGFEYTWSCFPKLNFEFCQRCVHLDEPAGGGGGVGWRRVGFGSGSGSALT